MNAIIYSPCKDRNVFWKVIKPLLQLKISVSDISVFSYKNYFVLIEQPMSFIYITGVI